MVAILGGTIVSVKTAKEGLISTWRLHQQCHRRQGRRQGIGTLEAFGWLVPIHPVLLES
eukprot:m.457265 g.457265  ORF g.457265 m.457265 type:complete len:59 (-) comp21220_c0_seq1:1673-1849(-)